MENNSLLDNTNQELRFKEIKDLIMDQVHTKFENGNVCLSDKGKYIDKDAFYGIIAMAMKEAEEIHRVAQGLALIRDRDIVELEDVYDAQAMRQKGINRALDLQ